MTRSQLIKIIHVAKRELRMDDDTYRQLLNTYAGIESTREMNIGQLNQILDAMKKSGLRSVLRRKKSSRPPTISRRKSGHCGWKWPTKVLFTTAPNGQSTSMCIA
jgi:phage gp16-like protein